MVTTTLRSRVVALAGVGVFAAGGTLSLFSRHSLLALDAAMREARGTVAGVTAAAVGRELTADLQTLESIAIAPRLQVPGLSSRPRRLAEAICILARDGSARCAPGEATSLIARPPLAATIHESIRQRRPLVSPFTAVDGVSVAVAAVPVDDNSSADAAAVAIINGDGVQMRDILGVGTRLNVESLDADAGPVVAVAGTPWTIAAVVSDGDDPIGAFRRRSIWVSPALAALAVLLATGIAISVNRPLASLTRAAERLAGGDLAGRFEGGDDEIGRLGVALEYMRVKLAESMEASARVNEMLERRVEERTYQLQRLLGNVISAQEDERRRVARELHDETSQLLAALSMSLHAGPAATADPGELLNRLQDGVHRLIVNLRPAVLDDLGLAAAIDMLAETQLRRAGITVRCELAELERHRLAPAIEITVFRIVQEAITNIMRHSGATSVLIQGGLDGGHVWVEIEDDGHGFDLAGIHPDGESLRGVGLLGMRERAELLGGRLTIDSAAGEGTRIKVEI
jgi:signal transduction histidine kinase